MEENKQRPFCAAAKPAALHIITKLAVGGAQENTMLTARHFDREQWNVEVLCGPQIDREGSLMGDVRQQGTPLTIEPYLVREIHPIKDAIAMVRLVIFLRRRRFDVVHTHSSKAGILGRWAAWLARVPVIVHTVHGWPFHDQMPSATRRFYIWLEQCTAPITDALIVGSDRDLQKGRRARIGHAEQYQVIRSAIDVAAYRKRQSARIAQREAWGVPLDANVVGTVTRLSEQKDPIAFIELARRVAEMEPDTRFVLVGDGPLRSTVDQKIKDMDPSLHIHVIGVSRNIQDVMSGFDVFALTSRWEGLPRVLPEAMSAGLPVVATEVGGNKEAIEQGQSGYLVPPGDLEVMAWRIVDLIQDPRKAEQMGLAGRARAEQEFRIETMIQDIAALYKRQLDQEESGLVPA